MSHVAPTPRRRSPVVAVIRRVLQSRAILPAIGIIAAADYVVWFLPSKTLVIVAALLHPGRWWRIAAWFTAGSVAGATAFAAVVAAVGPPILTALFGDLASSVAWQQAHAIVRQWGAAALFVAAALPWPLRTIVAACAVLDLPLAVIAASVAAGRFGGFSLLTWLCARVPGVLLRSPRIAAAFEQVTGGESGDPVASGFSRT
jgi:hypothetical protein